MEDGSYGASVISFDKGAEWVPLTAPTLDHNGVPLNCFPVSNHVPYGLGKIHCWKFSCEKFHVKIFSSSWVGNLCIYQ